MNHKSSWAEENRSPRKEEYKVEADNDAPRRILVNTRPADSSATGSANEEEVLIVASKLKQYVKDKHDMNTSANVMEALSNIVRRHTDRAIAKARSEGRKTLMDRDFE
jgi:predicted lactoylglutathione lyase